MPLHLPEPFGAFFRAENAHDLDALALCFSGNFPNSPVNLEHIFQLRGGKIASLEIH